VVARSWSAFLATVADDLNSGKWFVDEDTHELKLREFKSTKVEPGYLDILRWRMDQKYGRKGNRRRSQGPPNGQGSGSPSGSPYASPTAETGEPRGRSMQRFSGASPVASPNRPNYGKSSPLARVTEESSAPIKIHTNGIPAEKLVEVETPRPSEDQKSNKTLETLLEPVTLDDNKENAKVGESESKPQGLGLVNGNGKKATVEDDSTMKTIEI
jgi:hypothetical protein